MASAPAAACRTGEHRLQRLRLVGSAIAARPLEVAVSEAGAPPWTDGTTVYLDATASRAEQVRALAVQASLLAAGSLDPEVLGRLRSRRGAARRYLAVEGHRALVANEAFLPPSVLAVIDRATAATVDSAPASLELALGRERVAHPPDCFGMLRARRVIDARARDGGPSDDRRPAPASEPRAPRALPELEDDDRGDEEDDSRHLSQLLTSPVGGGGPIGRLLKRLLDPTRARGDDGNPGGDAATHRGRAWSSGARTVVSTTDAASSVDAAAPGARIGRTYPEWDVHRGRYRANWCTVVGSDPPLRDAAPAPMPDGAGFRRPLARLGIGLVARRRRPQGDDIDIDAAVEARVDELAGSPAGEALYVESVRQRRDLSVLVLLDVSGSANEPGPRGLPVHEHQRSVAAALTTALHDLGDRIALYAFNSQGRSSVRVLRVKGFDDRLDSRVARRLDGLVPGGYTRMGAAIRHGAALVEEQGGTARRLLVVLSDGFAYDHGYERRYGEADTRRALAEARRRGVGCLCLSIGAGVEAAALRRVFGTAAHASVPTPEQLTPVIGPLFRASLRAAETKQRMFRRHERTRERLEVEARLEGSRA